VHDAVHRTEHPAQLFYPPQRNAAFQSPSEKNAMTPNVSLASYPGKRHLNAAALAILTPPTEAQFGKLATDHIQLVPQNLGIVDDDLVDELKCLYPRTQFRLHANVRVLSGHVIADIAAFDLYPEWFTTAARISQRLGAPAYSAHSGYRKHATMTQMLENTRKMADLFQCPVAIEGQYPTESGEYLVSTWEEYREVLDSGLPYALDLSHLNIVRHCSGDALTLVQEMLSSAQCLEVHVSTNDGTGDHHQVCDLPSWWTPLLPYTNPGATVFSEGNQLRRRDPLRCIKRTERIVL